MDKSAAKIQFERYIIRKIDFQLNPDFSADPDKRELEIDINLQHALALDSQGKKAELSLLCGLSKDQGPFSLAVEIVGFFAYDGDLDDEQKQLLLTTNGSAILFPYLRAAISMVTMLSGIPAFVLPTFNIAQLIRSAKSSD